MARAGARIWAKVAASGAAAWPGPPASARTALSLGAVVAGTRRTLRETVPGTTPVRSSGTGTAPHCSEGASVCGHGAHPTAAFAAAGPVRTMTGTASNVSIHARIHG